jgi:hypothetical protein
MVLNAAEQNKLPLPPSRRDRWSRPSGVQFHDILYKVFRDILYTQPPNAVRAGGESALGEEGKDGMGDERGSGAKSAVCGSGESWGEEPDGFVPGV